jgi:hypothetical protein
MKSCYMNQRCASRSIFMNKAGFTVSCYLCCTVVICVVLLLFVLYCCYLCCTVVICVVRLLFVLYCCYLCCTVVICVVLLLFVLYYVLFVCKCVLYYCHRMTTQLQLTNISYIIIFFFFAVALRPSAGHGLLILEVF